METPKGWTNVTLGEIFTPEQLSEVEAIVMDAGNDVFETSHKLRPYLESIRDYLDAKGFDAGFLSYAIPYWFNEFNKQKNTKQDELDDIVNRVMGKSNPTNN